MIRSFLFLSVLFCATFGATSFAANPKEIRVPAVERSALQRVDRTRDLRGMPYRFAVPFSVKATPASHGEWSTSSTAGKKVWSLRVIADKATSVNLGFKQFFLPRGAALLIRTADGRASLRPFTHEDNERHGELWTPPLPGSELVVELHATEAQARAVRLVLGSVNSGYRSYAPRERIESGSCNVDVACKESAGWEGPIRSVAAISTGGSVFCTGFLVNNAAKDKKMYFMTAAHCGVNSRNAASLVTFWNYQNSKCREPGSSASGGSGDGKFDQFQTGAYFRASHAKSDFTLVELDDPADPKFRNFWAGFDATGVDAKSAVGIHHPGGDEKRISFENQSTTTTNYGDEQVRSDGTHVRVTDWDLGTTEPGSSGSPLFDQNQRVIGQLHGGGAACGNDESDWYGRIAVSWTGGGTKETRLSDWLGGGDSGAKVVDGMGGVGSARSLQKNAVATPDTPR